MNIKKRAWERRGKEDEEVDAKTFPARRDGFSTLKFKTRGVG